MAEDGNIRYLRYILLLGEGVLLVLRGIIRREVVRTGSTLEAILTISNNRQILESRCSSQTQCLHLYPSGSAVNSDINTWDISLLTLVLQRLFWTNLPSSERLRICFLRDNRNEFQGHPPALSMDETDYATRSADLITVLQDLASGLDQHTQDELTTIINNSSSVDFNYHAAINCLQQLYEFKEEMIQELRNEFEAVNLKLDTMQDESKEHKQLTRDIGAVQSHMHEDLLDTKSLAEENKQMLQATSESIDIVKEEVSGSREIAESNQKLLRSIEQMMIELMAQGREPSRIQQDVNANINIKSHKEENATEAQNLIVTTVNDILKQIRPDVMEESEKAEAILKKVNELLIRHKGRDYELMIALLELIRDILRFGYILEAKKGSVKLKIRFTSYRGCLDFIQYLSSKKCQDCLKDASQALTKRTGHVMSLSADISEESLLNLHKHLVEECEKHRLTRTVLLPVQFKGITNLNNIWNLLQKGGADKHTKQLSEILTRMVGGNVTVTTSVDMLQFEQALNNIENERIRQPGAALKDEKTERILLPGAALIGECTEIPRRYFGSAEQETERILLPELREQLTFKPIAKHFVTDKPDRMEPYITKIELLPDDRILLGDSVNRNLKMLDSSFKLVSSCDLSHMSFPKTPWHPLPGFPINICYIDNERAAVSSNANCIQIVNVSDGLVMEKFHQLDHTCSGLACYGDILYISDWDGTVYTYTTEVTLKGILYTFPVHFLWPYPKLYSRITPLAISDDGEKIYIGSGERITTVDNKGNHLSTLEIYEWRYPINMSVVGDGTVFVCDRSGDILLVDYGGQNILEVWLSPKCGSLRSLCFDRKYSRLILGGWDRYVYVYELQK